VYWLASERVKARRLDRATRSNVLMRYYISTMFGAVLPPVQARPRMKAHHP
jgi:hypothetical protein